MDLCQKQLYVLSNTKHTHPANYVHKTKENINSFSQPRICFPVLRISLFYTDIFMKSILDVTCTENMFVIISKTSKVKCP